MGRGGRTIERPGGRVTQRIRRQDLSRDPTGPQFARSSVAAKSVKLLPERRELVDREAGHGVNLDLVPDLVRIVLDRE